ncbi:succinate-semialdehyde dehydrogenase (NADP(+)) [Pseudidiomarina aestuarii]|uniref:Succinate-semialdehyde dehydrogenase (NADP(+)) n=1 Tax=Pseudidiomarina aestuarii TaxID=624146 RepID=A0A7Z6ZUT5_9GAMM|nr:NAD-dependent succinate-semialdehyde dehydrogenase [Pseudidiomarina aestuarii]RUO41596.1 succinate-semialdehyde dehydrogenase (NADP(+)) [Pseudidiomarina aestuarii]
MNPKPLQGVVDNDLLDATWFYEVADSFAVMNPATGEDFAWVPDASAADASVAVAAAAAEFPRWSGLAARERAKVLFRWADLLLEHRADLGALLSYEQGKPVAEAIGEIEYSASYVQWFAEEATRLYGDTIPAPASSKRIFVTKQAVGVVTVITPWNFPMAMLARKAVAALAAGCTLVAKPAQETPLSAFALHRLAVRAGLSAAAFAVVAGTASAAIGEVLTQHQAVAKFSFTGSTRVGRLLAAQCASTVKRVSLELGGNAPFIVFADADIEAALDGLMLAKFRNAGQTCVCANRVLVDAAIADEFTERLAARVSALRVGPAFTDDGSADDVQIGPLIHERAATGLRELLSRAVADGARLVGAEAVQGDGAWLHPCVVADVRNDSELAQSELFGPVAPVIRFRNEAEALTLANATEYGLAAYLYSRDIGRCLRVAEGLQFGMVGINDGAISNAAAPFGGMKQSGYGREGSKYGLDDYVETKYLSIGGI